MSSSQHSFRLMCLYCKGEGVEYTDSTKLKDHLIEFHPEYVNHLEFDSCSPKSKQASTSLKSPSSFKRNGKETSPVIKQSPSNTKGKGQRFSPLNRKTSSSSAFSNYENSNEKINLSQSQPQLQLSESKTGFSKLDHCLPTPENTYKSEKDLKSDSVEANIAKKSKSDFNGDRNENVFQKSEMLRQKFKEVRNDGCKPRRSETKFSPLVPAEDKLPNKDKEFVPKAESLCHSNDCSRKDVASSVKENSSLIPQSFRNKVGRSGEKSERRQSFSESIRPMDGKNSNSDLKLDTLSASSSPSSFRRKSFTDEERLNMGLSPIKKNHILESLEDIFRSEISIQNEKSYSSSLQSQLLNEQKLGMFNDFLFLI